MTRTPAPYWAIAAVMLAACTAAYAQNGDNAFDTFRMSPVTGHAFIIGDYETDTRNQTNNSTKTSSLFMQEGIELKTDGSIYHPNLFNWFGEMRLGFNQQDIDTDGTQRKSDGVLLGYDLDGTLFRQKPLSIRMFSSYNQSHTNRDFNEPSEYESMNHGFQLRHRGTLESSFLFEYDRRIEDSISRESDKTTYRAEFETRYKRENIDLELRYEHEQTDEMLGDNDLTSDSDELEFTNDLRFGEGERQHSLSGRTYFNTRTGFFTTDTYGISQRLNLRHTETFTTFYNGEFRRTTTEGVDDEIILGSAGFTKSIYDSLDITGRATYDQQTFTGGEEKRYGGDLSLSYRKQTPIGRYSSSLLMARRWVTEDTDSGTRSIIGESLTYADDFDTTADLNETDVVIASIEIFSTDRTITYLEGYHYDILESGNEVTIIRNLPPVGPYSPPGGTTSTPDAMPNSVIVDYTVERALSGEYHDDRIIWTHRLHIESLHLTPYVTFEYFKETLIVGIDPGNLQHRTSIRAGIEYSHNGFFAGYEYETTDSRLGLAYDSHRIDAQYVKSIGRDMNLSIGADAQWLTYAESDLLAADEEPYLNSYHAHGQFTQRINRNLLWRVRADWHDISGRQNTMNAELSTRLEWRYRQLEFSVNGRYRVFEQGDTDGDVMGVAFELRRYF